MTGKDRNSPEHWRERAKKARAHAEELTDREARSAMCGIADTYDKLAERAEKIQRDLSGMPWPGQGGGPK
jgi:hypothetical protein